MVYKVAVIGGSGFVGSKLIEDMGSESCYIIDKKESPFFSEICKIKNICDEGLDAALNTDTDCILLLAAEHRDDVSPTSLYYEVNVEGTRKVLDAMDRLNIRHITFTSSVAVYGLNKVNPDEDHPEDPFNHYGKSKWQAEEILRNWHNQDPKRRTLTIVRPTVIFGERNRGNVYNLLKQIASGRFLMIGKGNNKKSMAYVGNISAFLQYCLEIREPGYRVYNYVDKPDMNMKDLVSLVRSRMGNEKKVLKIPYFLGMIGGYCFDLLSWISRKQFAISSVRVKKFCATTQFDAGKAHASEFKAPYTLGQGLKQTLDFEFLSQERDAITFETE